MPQGSSNRAVRPSVYRCFRRPNQEEALSRLSYLSKSYFLVTIQRGVLFRANNNGGEGSARRDGPQVPSYLSLYSAGVLRQVNGAQIHSYRVRKKRQMGCSGVYFLALNYGNGY